ncbi:hypothetical protein MSG28_005068 [Choristoneura fumiferana]|uniref:Uncharacterized protein n=1 Tax=Choristoneura fumiferana TaxID=7141 RepID=A0ACC0JPN9_CHOFU|nr:hypothetical protein MSG28_005068 [Choristoneura fumiferana]
MFNSSRSRSLCSTMWTSRPRKLHSAWVVSGPTTHSSEPLWGGDHTEVIELDYDPKTVSFEDLLEMFWANHEYGLTTKLKRQSMILYHDEEQRTAAQASYKEVALRFGELRHKDLCRSLGLDSKKLQTSHLAARLNGYLVGVGGMAQFESEVGRLGLSEKQAEYVRTEIERNEGGGLAC